LRSPIEQYLERLHAAHRDLRDGDVATYIPELAKANPEWFGISLATADGRVYEVGDTAQSFTIQSISKPLTYGLVLEDRGRSAVLAKIGVEPTGDAFNSISLAPGTGSPLNPMINAGAIAAASLVAGNSQQDKLERLLSVYSMYAGRALAIDGAVFQSERATGHRNRAIGHMLRNFDVLSGDPEPPLDLYFSQCSVSVTCRDLSLIAATLANGGINPVTGERALRSEFVADVLSVMTTCGMYDYAGQWVYSVGMPAKSGVAGGVLVVLPGQLGIGVFSPRLDARGNSVRGVAVCRALSEDLQLHFLRTGRPSHSVVRARYSVATVRSKRRRPEHERQTLRADGDRAVVYELQGDLVLPAVEVVIRSIVDKSDAIDLAVIDLQRVTGAGEPAARMFLDLLRSFHDGGKQLVLVADELPSRFLRVVEEENAAMDRPVDLVKFADLDAALEWCEDRVLERAGPSIAPLAGIELGDHELCRGIDARGLRQLREVLERRRFSEGETIVRKGDPASEMFLLMSGEVSVVLALGSEKPRRLATVSPGMTFGELALLDRAPRSADVRADQAVECYALSAAAFQGLGETHPELKIRLLENLLRGTYQMVSALNVEVAALASTRGVQ
jgi:glutaminase